MRLLADESCDFRIVRALRAAGHDITAVIEFAPGRDDASVLEIAVHEQRTFITEDRDFGQLVYASTKPGPGVILVRYPSTQRAGLPAIMVEILKTHAEQLRGRFIVVQPGRIRLAGIPIARP
jgi:predicted nuclease of predicted toxin-antitoxin system